MKNFCSYYNEGICRSCELISLDYSDQIKSKLSQLEEALSSFSHIPTLPPVTSPIKHFRNKAKLIVTGSIEAPILGLWGTEDLDQGRELLNCPLHLEEINSLLPTLKDFIRLVKISPYQIAEKKGELKGIIIFYSKECNESYLRFVLRSKESIDRIKKHIPFLMTKHPYLKCVSANIQPIPHAILEGEEEIILSDAPHVHQSYGNIRLSLNPRAFVQTNQTVAKMLYETAAQWIKEESCENFLELFCGQGAFSFHTVSFIKKGLGVEINATAVAEANETATTLGFSHLSFLASDAAKARDHIRKFKPDVILVNPPRRGLGDSIDLLLEEKPKFIIYSSCNHVTLAKDLEKLAGPYSIQRAQLFDMFPHSKHFETLLKLKLKDV